LKFNVVVPPAVMLPHVPGVNVIVVPLALLMSGEWLVAQYCAAFGHSVGIGPDGRSTAAAFATWLIVPIVLVACFVSVPA